MRKILCIDTETTGLDANKNSLWQIGAYYRNKNGQVFTIDLKCCPLDVVNITQEALNVCNKTKEELLSLPPANTVYESFRNFLVQETLDGEKITWCGYNCRFDQGFMESFFKTFDPQDSIWKFFDRHHVDMLEFMRMLRATEITKASSLKLGTVYEMFGINPDTAHDALEDARVTFMAYQWMESVLMKGISNGIK